MAGGTWLSQNKKQPGVYINFKSSPNALVSIGDRGIVAIGKELSWGDTEELIEINSMNEVYEKLGYDITSEHMLFIREILRGTSLSGGASTIYVGRLLTTDGAAAKVSSGGLTITANYIGSRGNDITVIVAPDLNTGYGDENKYAVYTVTTVVDGAKVDEQKLGSWTSETIVDPATIGALKNNAWVTFSGTATATLDDATTAGAPLVGGADGTLATTAWSSFLSKIEPIAFNILIYDGSESVTKEAVFMFVKRMSEGTGMYCQAVMANYPSADSEMVISVKNGFKTLDGQILTPEQATWWVGGCSAGANYNQSLTYAAHAQAVQAVPRYTSDELDDAIEEGSLVFFEEYGQVKILTDINSFTTVTPTKAKHFSKNRVIRVLWSIANDCYRTFSQSYIGKVDNDEDGRKLFKATIVGYLNEMQANHGIQNFEQDDVEVLPGNDVDSIIINVAVQPVDAVEKIYMTVTIS